MILAIVPVNFVAQERYPMETKPMNDIGRVVATAEYPPKPSATTYRIMVIQGHRLRRSNLEIYETFMV